MSNRNDLDENLETRWGYLTLLTVPIICVIGNCMVITAVWRTKALQTPTNYLLLSLAAADLIIGLFAMPFSIYLSVNNLHWHLSISLCQFYCSVDVAASTSSIIHMVLISIDRLVAAAKPADYKTTKHRSRIYTAILIAWCFSIALSLPLGTSLNTRTGYYIELEHHCGIYSPVYMLCSSIFAFFIPCIVMILTYSYIFHVLQQRLRTISLREMAGGQLFGFGADVGNITTLATQKTYRSGSSQRFITWEKPFLKSIEKSAVEHANSLNDSEKEQLQRILEAHETSLIFKSEEEELVRRPSVILDANTVPVSDAAAALKRRTRSCAEVIPLSLPKSESHTDNSKQLYISRYSLSARPFEDRLQEQSQISRSKMRRLSSIITDWDRVDRSSMSDFTRFYTLARCDSFYCAKRKLAGVKNWALELVARLRLRQGVTIRRERRATKLVAVVLAAFLICWLPFFTLNTVKVYRLMYSSWSAELEIWFHWFTALGYLNSSLNFFIYFAVNKKFRATFCCMLKIGGQKRRNSSALPSIRTVAETRETLSYHRGNRNRGKMSPRKYTVPEIVVQKATDDGGMLSTVPSISNEESANFRYTEEDKDTIAATIQQKAKLLCPQMCYDAATIYHHPIQQNNFNFYDVLVRNDTDTLL